MPRHASNRRSIKTYIVDTIVFVGVFALVGHFAGHFWERYAIQSELTQMKSSLHSLKETINNIENAYDGLQKELHGLVNVAEKKQVSKFTNKRDMGVHYCNAQHSLDRRTLHDMHLQAIAQAKKDMKPEAFKLDEKSTGVRELNTKSKNATTLTRYPLKSTGVGSKEFKKSKKDFGHDDIYKCYENQDCCEYACTRYKF